VLAGAGFVKALAEVMRTTRWQGRLAAHREAAIRVIVKPHEEIKPLIRKWRQSLSDDPRAVMNLLGCIGKN
jgi:hypothetical protein